MATKPTLTLLPVGTVVDVAAINTALTALADEFANVLGTDGTTGADNQLSGDVDVNGNILRNANFTIKTSGGSEVNATQFADDIDASKTAAAASATAAASSATSSATSATASSSSATASAVSAAAAASSAEAIDNIGAVLTFDTFTGTGSQASFTLTDEPRSKNALVASVKGTYQAPNTFSVVGKVVTFSTIPAAGDPITIQNFGGQVGIGFLDPNIVGTVELKDNAVTLAKIAGGTAGAVLGFDSAGDPAEIVPNTAGFVLTDNGAGNAPTMQLAPGFITEFASDVFAVKDNIDTTKKLRFNVAGVTTATTRTITIPDSNFSLAFAATMNQSVGTGDSPTFVNITPTGTVDGRDVAGDGTKLDGIEALADITDATNVAAALTNNVAALTAGEVTQLANIGTNLISATEWGVVASLNQSLGTGDSPTFNAITVTTTVDGRDLSVDGSKLDGIEALADVTDATNVAAALGNGLENLTTSEVTQLGNIGANLISNSEWGIVASLNQAVGSTDAPTFAGLTLTADLDMSSNNIISLAAPVNATDAATKAYVDAFQQGVKAKDFVDTTTTANITLSGEQTIDGFLTSASRVLVKDQTDPTENGIYVSAAGAWVRSIDADTGDEILAATTKSLNGTANGGFTFINTNLSAITLGVTNITFANFGDTVNHASLNGLQGGSGTEFFHLTSQQHSDLTSLTTAEIAQVANIGATTVSAAQWGFVGGADQALKTTDTVVFNNLTVNGTVLVSLAGSQALTVQATGATVVSKEKNVGDANFIEYRNSAGTRRGILGYSGSSSDNMTLTNETATGNLVLGANNLPTLTLDAAQDAKFRGSVGFNNTAPVAKPTITGARASNAALASLLTALAATGILTDSTTA